MSGSIYPVCRSYTVLPLPIPGRTTQSRGGNPPAALLDRVAR